MSTPHRDTRVPPAVSVVMSVFDQPRQVEATIESVLSQQNVSLQLVVIDDGSDLAVQRVLSNYQDLQEVVLERRANQGLTAALARACELASHDYLARIDVGDRMLPGRLAAQAALLDQRPEVGLVTSWVEVVTTEGYPLYRVANSADELHVGLTTAGPQQTVTPFHASVMMRADDYHKVGGYRAAFYFAQDFDLWSRLIRVSEIAVIEQVLTQGLFSPAGLSSRHASAQRQLRDLIVALRNNPDPQAQQALMTKAATIRPQAHSATAAKLEADEFAGLYFIARCLARRNSAHAGSYFVRALKCRPWSVKALLGYCSWRLSQLAGARETPDS